MFLMILPLLVVKNLNLWVFGGCFGNGVVDPCCDHLQTDNVGNIFGGSLLANLNIVSLLVYGRRRVPADWGGGNFEGSVYARFGK